MQSANILRGAPKLVCYTMCMNENRKDKISQELHSCLNTP